MPTIKWLHGTARLPETTWHAGEKLDAPARLGAAIAGIPLVVDSTIPDGEIHVRMDGKTFMRIESK